MIVPLAVSGRRNRRLQRLTSGKEAGLYETDGACTELPQALPLESATKASQRGTIPLAGAVG